MAIQIKKYKNRRLYDTQSSKYITQEQLKSYVLEGVEFKVEDVDTGTDITNAILLQIIVDIESGTTQFLSQAFLRQIICLSNHPMHASYKLMMDQMLSTIDMTLKNDPYQKATEAWNKQLSEAVTQWQNLFK